MTAPLYLAVPSLTATFGGAILTYQVAVAYRTRPQPGELLMPLRRSAGYVERAAVLALAFALGLAFRIGVEP